MELSTNIQSRTRHVPESSPRKGLFQRIWQARTSYLLLLPFLIPFTVFVVIPIISSGYLSLTEYIGGQNSEFRFVGTDNFRQLLSLDLRELPPKVSAANQPLYRCDGKEIEIASGGAIPDGCTALFVASRQVVPAGYREMDRINILGKTYVLSATDARFWTALKNTLIYTLIVVPFGSLIGLLLALALQKQTRFNYLLRTIFFLPSVTSSIAIAVVWKWIFVSENYGLINSFLNQLGIKSVTFLADKQWTMPIMVLIAVWGAMGYNMILFLAGLKNIPDELYEAAAIDGATSVGRVKEITLPLLRPTMLYVGVTGMISALQVFDTVYIIFRSVERIGGVLDSGLTVVPYLYDTGFTQLQLGYASSIAWVLFIVIFILTLCNLYLGHVNDAY